MSGGHFEYKQYHIDEIADEIEHFIKTNDDNTLNEYGEPKYYHFSKEVIKEFKKAAVILRKAAIYTKAVDWLVSGDTGEESFLTNLKEDLKEVRK